MEGRERNGTEGEKKKWQWDMCRALRLKDADTEGNRGPNQVPLGKVDVVKKLLKNDGKKKC